MKEKLSRLRVISIAATFVFACNISFAQTQMDTVKTGKTGDPMVVDPGKANDGSVVNPGKTNDDMAAFTDTGFITKNIMDNMMEIRLAKSGQSKGTSSQVKKIAALLVNDHTVMLNDLKKLAVKKGVSPKSYMSGMHSVPMNITPGGNFDKAWVSQMLTMHEAKIAELENYINLSSDEDIKAAATRALPKIKLHRDMLMKIPGAKSRTGIA